MQCKMPILSASIIFFLPANSSAASMHICQTRRPSTALASALSSPLRSAASLARVDISHARVILAITARTLLVETQGTTSGISESRCTVLRTRPLVRPAPPGATASVAPVPALLALPPPGAVVSAAGDPSASTPIGAAEGARAAPRAELPADVRACTDCTREGRWRGSAPATALALAAAAAAGEGRTKAGGTTGRTIESDGAEGKRSFGCRGAEAEDEAEAGEAIGIEGAE